jgi:hypothetical protein
MAQVGAQADHTVAGAEAASQQPILMELLKPLRIVDVGLSARDVLDVARVHEQYLETTRFEHFEDGNPVHACRLHGHRLDADLFEPIGELVEIAAKRPEGANRPWVAVVRHGDYVEGRADIDPGGIWVDRRKLPRRFPARLLAPWHGPLPPVP